VKRIAGAIAVLVLLVVAIVGVADKNRAVVPSGAGGSTSSRTDPATELEQSIERARARQARADGLAERLSPPG
jgi:hypothetical protein